MSKLNPLYEAILQAREACAGDSVKEKSKLLELVQKSIDVAQERNAEVIVHRQLARALTILQNTVCYNDRLPADNILCDLLNLYVPEYIEEEA